jgi:hypothetical protein
MTDPTHGEIEHQPDERTLRTWKGEVVQEGHPVQPDANERADATGWTRPLESDSMTMIAVDDPLRPARLARVRDEVAAGRYHPPAELVAERLLAFLGPPWAR